MAANQSFDITTGCDLQEVDNAVNQTNKELGQRFDFRGVKFSIELKRAEKLILLTAPEEYKLDAIWDVLQSKLVRRGVSLKNVKRETNETAGGHTLRQKLTLVQGIETEKAKEIAKWIKDQKWKKVQASIQGEQLRVTSPSRDELQTVMAALKTKDWGIELKFGNFRSQ